MPTLYFPEKHKQLVEELAKDPGDGAKPIFPNLRDLMLFAAMVGRYLDKKTSRAGKGGEVESNYFSSGGFNKEGVIYLLGLLEFEDPEIFKQGAPECWKLFEQYCAAGMDEIQSWLLEAEGVVDYPDLIQSQLLERARGAKKKPVIIVKPKIRPIE